MGLNFTEPHRDYLAQAKNVLHAYEVMQDEAIRQATPIRTVRGFDEAMKHVRNERQQIERLIALGLKVDADAKDKAAAVAVATQAYGGADLDIKIMRGPGKGE